MENGKCPQQWAKRKWTISSTICFLNYRLIGAMDNILNYGRRENVKISSTTCIGKIEKLRYYFCRENGMYPLLWRMKN
jgi:hypothetical protein